MGPPLPSMKPPPQGTKHCQRNEPPYAGVLKLNFSKAYGPDVHGDCPHSEFADSTGPGEATGTNRCRLGIANVCPTLQPDQPLINDSVLVTPLGWFVSLNYCTVTVPPSVPCTWLQKLLRRGVQPS